MSTVSALLRTVVCFRVCVWDSISNADGIAGGNALPHARACVKQTTNRDTIEVRNTSCPCVCIRVWVLVDRDTPCPCVPGCVGLLVCVSWFDMVVKVSKVSNVACDALESLGFGDSTLQFPKCRMCRIGAWVVTARNSVVMAGIVEVTR